MLSVLAYGSTQPSRPAPGGLPGIGGMGTLRGREEVEEARGKEGEIAAILESMEGLILYAETDGRGLLLREEGWAFSPPKLFICGRGGCEGRRGAC